MGTLQSGVGLYSGLDINGLVGQLIAIEGRPVSILKNKVDQNTAIQTAIQGLSLKLATAQLTSSRLTSTQSFASRTANASSDAISATAGPKATTGSFTFTPKRMVTTQQLMSTGFASADAKVGEGTLTIARGGFVDQSTLLSNLNGGAGVRVGSIEIVNRAGNSAQIDLTGATSIRDVVEAINATSGLAVRASVSGDRLQLEDLTGGSGNIIVQEVGGGSTAADLGILGSTAGATHVGSDIHHLGSQFDLRALNDGNGVRSYPGLDDFTITDDTGSYGIDISDAKNLGDVIELIQTKSGGNITATIVDNKLQLSGTGTITVTRNQDPRGNDIRAADDLGIAGSAAGTLTGSNILGGLDTVLLKNLNGGSGIGTTGTININGTNIDLTAAETLQDVVKGINASGVSGVTARINDARNGLVIESTSGPLEIADVNGTLAAGLKIQSTLAENKTSVNSGSLNQKYISESTRLDSLNGGSGVPKGKFRLIDGNGKAAIVDLTQDADDTIGDVIREINSRGLAVNARINDTGDGILIENTAGTGVITIAEEGNGGTAKALNLLGSSEAGGNLDGSFKISINLSATDTITDVVNKLKAANAPVAADLLNDGSGLNPVRLNLTSKQSGRAGELLIDTGSTSIKLNTISRGKDAVVLFGAGEGGLAPVQLTSGKNTFNNILPGVSIDVKGVSSQPVTVTVSEDTSAVVDALSDFVDSFNSIKDYIAEYRTYNAETGVKGLLFNESSVRAAESALNNFINNNYANTGSVFRTLGELGVRFDGNGKLSFDESAFRETLAKDPESVQKFFTTKTDGLTDRFKATVESLTDPVDGLLTNRVDSLSATILRQNSSITNMQSRLDVRKERLFNQFVGLEIALAEMSTQQTALQQLSYLAATVSAGGFKL